MKTLTLTAWYRLEYLKQMLDSLRQNNLEGYDLLYCAIEPGRPEVADLCTSIDFIPTKVFVNPFQRGVRINPYSALEAVFHMGSDFNVYLEEDIVLSPDALDMANWYQGQAEDTLCLPFFNYHSSPDDPAGIKVERECEEFAALGFALTRQSWEKWFQPYWFMDDYSKGKIGWDWAVRYAANKHGLEMLMPLWARSNHIGQLGGMHCSAEFHDQTFAHLSISDGSSRNYEIAG